MLDSLTELFLIGRPFGVSIFFSLKCWVSLQSALPHIREEFCATCIKLWNSSPNPSISIRFFSLPVQRPWPLKTTDNAHPNMQNNYVKTKRKVYMKFLEQNKVYSKVVKDSMPHILSNCFNKCIVTKLKLYYSLANCLFSLHLYNCQFKEWTFKNHIIHCCITCKLSTNVHFTMYLATIIFLFIFFKFARLKTNCISQLTSRKSSSIRVSLSKKKHKIKKQNQA